MKFIIDENLSRRMVRVLREHGHDAWHSTELVGGSAGDDQIWREALTRGSIIVSKDIDFVAFLAGPPPHTPIVRLEIGNCTTTEAIDLLLAHLEDVANEIAAGRLLLSF